MAGNSGLLESSMSPQLTTTRVAATVNPKFDTDSTTNEMIHILIGPKAR